MTEKEIKEETKNKDFLTELDVTKFIASVHNRIKTEVGSDFVLAKLEPHEKEYVIERTQSAYKYKSNMENLKNKKIFNRELTKLEKYEIQKNANKTFDTLMIKPIMLSIMNRNIDQNYLLEVISLKRKEMMETQGQGEEQYNIGEQLITNDEK